LRQPTLASDPEANLRRKIASLQHQLEARIANLEAFQSSKHSPVGSTASTFDAEVRREHSSSDMTWTEANGFLEGATSLSDSDISLQGHPAGENNEDVEPDGEVVEVKFVVRNTFLTLECVHAHASCTVGSTFAAPSSRSASSPPFA